MPVVSAVAVDVEVEVDGGAAGAKDDSACSPVGVEGPAPCVSAVDGVAARAAEHTGEAGSDMV